jgi:hypothetical protein
MGIQNYPNTYGGSGGDYNTSPNPYGYNNQPGPGNYGPGVSPLQNMAGYMQNNYDRNYVMNGYNQWRNAGNSQQQHGSYNLGTDWMKVAIELFIKYGKIFLS